MKFSLLSSCILLFTTINQYAQSPKIKYIPGEIDFSQQLQVWDGFGFNYVEAAQTRDYKATPQDYGGFSLLKENDKKEILDLVFGQQGLRVQIVKMFLDPYHQPKPGGPYDHETTTQNMRYFVEQGEKIALKRNDRLDIITTLYGPPAWATQQKFIGGRDLDTTQAGNLCDYMIDWVKYLRDHDYPVSSLSLHNEGEDFYRWNFDDGTQRLKKFDYNMYWPPEQVNDFLTRLPPKLKEAGINDIRLTNGEPSNWTRFYYWDYANTLSEDENAMENLGLITSHGFINGDFRKLSYGLAINKPIRILKDKKPGLHAWVTSFSWGDMGTDFIKTAHEQIYAAGVNALIPWAGIQNPSQWYGGDPNPGCAIRINDDGSYEVLQGYYFYKQLTRAGYRHMSVAQATLSNPAAFIIAFGKNGTEHPDAFVVTSNIYIWTLPLRISVRGTNCKQFKAYRSSEDGTEKFKDIGIFDVEDGAVIYDPPKGTTTTFIGIE